MADSRVIYGRKFRWPKAEVFISSVSIIVASLALWVNKCSLDNTTDMIDITQRRDSLNAISAFRRDSMAADALRVEAEPFVDVTNVRFEKVKVGQPITVHYTILNMGRGPALITGVQFYTALLPFIRIDSLPFPTGQNVTAADTMYRYIYSESRSVDRTVQNKWQTVTQSQFDSLKNGDYKLWFEAHVYYIGSLPKTDTASIDYASYTNRLNLDVIEEQRRVPHNVSFGWIDHE